MNRALKRRAAHRAKSGEASGSAPQPPRGDNPDNLVRQALQLHQSGRRDQAEALYRQVLAARPGHAAAQHFLGLLLHQIGRGDDGLALIEQSVRAEPRNPDFLNNLGAVLRDRGRLEDSARLYLKAVAIRPDHAGARDNLAAVQRQLEQFDAAAETYRGSLVHNPFHVKARIGLAETLQDAGRLDEALDVYREALSLRPKDPDLLHRLGVGLTEKGSLDEAAETFRRAIALAPADARSWMSLAQVKRHDRRDAEFETMEAVHARTPAESPERMALAFALGKANDDLKAYDRAFDYFAEGNAIKRRGHDYDAARTRQDFEAMKAVFDEELFAKYAGCGNSDETPIFIVGMPRSGTTLVEQIIASHPAVYGAGELELMKRAISDNFPAGTAGGFPANIASAPPRAFADAGKAYVDTLSARYPGFARVTDKMPGNFMLIGFIHLMLPKARIVHVARNAEATCLSIYKTHFRNEGHRYGYDLAELADFHNLYADMMAHWRAVIPGAVHEVRYEDFVADQEGQTRALINHCGLEWDDACLAFHQTDRPVRTASAAQVRQPMYKGSVDLWKRYGDRLKPLVDRLI